MKSGLLWSQNEPNIIFVAPNPTPNSVNE